MKESYISQMRYRLYTNEKGVILPISLFLLFLFTLVTIHAATKFEKEKQSFHHIEKTYDLEILLLQAYRDVKRLYEEDPSVKEGEFQYEDGKVIFKLLNKKESTYSLKFECFSGDAELIMELEMPKIAEK